MYVAVVVQREHGACEVWKVVFAIQSHKYYLVLCRVHLVPAPSFYGMGIPLQPLDVNFVFSINYADCIYVAGVVVGARDGLNFLFRLMQ